MNFFVTGPNGESLVTEDRKLDSLHSIDVKQTGEYTICLDNSFSHVSEKMVFVDIIIEDDSGEVKENPSIQYNVDNAEVDLKLQNLSVSGDRWTMLPLAGLCYTLPLLPLFPSSITLSHFLSVNWKSS